MNYTIAWLEEAHGGITVDYGKNGNRYYISIHDRQSGDYCSREWAHNERNAAQQMFHQIAGWIMNSEYSYADRERMFLEGVSE